MSFKLDHAIIGVYDLETAIQNYADMGFTVLQGGEHADGATHNALISFQDGSYIELLAPTGRPASGGAMSFLSLLDDGEGILGYALLSDDLDADVAEIRARGITIGDVKTGGRMTPEGVNLEWKSAMIDGTRSPFFVQDVTPREDRVSTDVADTTHPNQVNSISELSFVSDDLSKMVDFYKAILGEEGQRFEDDVIFAVGKTTLALSSAKRREQREHVKLRNDAPFSLQVRTSLAKWSRNQEFTETNNARLDILAKVSP